MVASLGLWTQLNGSAYARRAMLCSTPTPGSTSYGEEFANTIDLAYPGYENDDHVGVDALTEQGYVDSDQLYVTGGQVCSHCVDRWKN